MNGWDTIREEKFERMKAMGIADESMNFSSRDEAVMAWNEISENEKIKFDARMSVYAAQIDRMDRGIGEILKSLKENGELENTVIFFLSDNGGSVCHQTKLAFLIERVGTVKYFYWFQIWV